MTDIQKALLGKKITSFDLVSDGSCITFQIEGGGSVRLRAVGDCCSETWIESIDAPEALIGTVSDVGEIDMPSLGNVPTERHQYVDQVDYYGLKITTEKGRVVLDYRNDSNGYYGGWLEVAP